MTEQERLEHEITAKEQYIRNRNSDLKYFQALIVIAEKDLKDLFNAYQNLAPPAEGEAWTSPGKPLNAELNR